MELLMVTYAKDPKEILLAAYCKKKRQQLKPQV